MSFGSYVGMSTLSFGSYVGMSTLSFGWEYIAGQISDQSIEFDSYNCVITFCVLGHTFSVAS